MSFSFISNDILISSGGVLIDEVNQKVLIIKELTLGEYLLPKGGKEDNETIEETAIREVYEETGYKNQLNEPPLLLAIQIRPHVNGRVGQHKVIYWFYTRLVCDKQELNTQQENEHFQSEWHTFESALKVLSYDNDKRLVSYAFHVFNKSPRLPSELSLKNCLKQSQSSDSIRAMLLAFEFERIRSVLITDQHKKHVLIDTRGHCHLSQSVEGLDLSRSKPFGIQLIEDLDNENSRNRCICKVFEWYVIEGKERKIKTDDKVKWFVLQDAINVINCDNEIIMLKAFIDHLRKLSMINSV